MRTRTTSRPSIRSGSTKASAKSPVSAAGAPSTAPRAQRPGSASMRATSSAASRSGEMGRTCMGHRSRRGQVACERINHAPGAGNSGAGDFITA